MPACPIYEIANGSVHVPSGAEKARNGRFILGERFFRHASENTPKEWRPDL